METIKIEVIWPFEKNLFIKLLIKTFNTNRMGQKRHSHKLFNLKNRWVLFFPHCWIEKSFLKFHFNCNKQFLLSSKIFTFRGAIAKALFLNHWKETLWAQEYGPAICSSLPFAPLKCTMWLQLSPDVPGVYLNVLQTRSPHGGRYFLSHQGWPLTLEAQGPDSLAPQACARLLWGISYALSIKSREQMNIPLRQEIPLSLNNILISADELMLHVVEVQL